VDLESLPGAKGEDFDATTADYISVRTKSRDEVNVSLERSHTLPRYLSAKKEEIGVIFQHYLKPFQNRTFFIIRDGLPGAGTIGVRDI